MKNLKAIIQNSDTLDLLIFDAIGDERVSAKTVVNLLNENRGKPVNVRLNSGGGSAYDGISIYNALQAHHAPVTTIIEGIAASAAAIISQGGSKRVIYNSANLMIHQAAALVVGNATELLDTAKILQKLDQRIASIFAAKAV